MINSICRARPKNTLWCLMKGFPFKIQANMDPSHRDRISFLMICSGKYSKGMKMHHVRLDRDIQISNALTFMAGNREQTE